MGDTRARAACASCPPAASQQAATGGACATASANGSMASDARGSEAGPWRPAAAWPAAASVAATAGTQPAERTMRVSSEATARARLEPPASWNAGAMPAAAPWTSPLQVWVAQATEAGCEEPHFLERAVLSSRWRASRIPALLSQPPPPGDAVRHRARIGGVQHRAELRLPAQPHAGPDGSRQLRGAARRQRSRHRHGDAGQAAGAVGGIGGDQQRVQVSGDGHGLGRKLGAACWPYRRVVEAGALSAGLVA